MRSGGLRWIPIAFSTLGLTTTPRLSTIRLNLTHSQAPERPTQTQIKDLGEDLRPVADECVRIQREFEGVVDFDIFGDLWFQEVLDPVWGHRKISLLRTAPP